MHGNVAFGALQSKSDVVCEGEHGVVAEFVGKLQVGGLNDLGRDREHTGRQLLEKRQVMFIHVVEGALDRGERQIARPLVDSEGDALAKRNDAPTL